MGDGRDFWSRAWLLAKHHAGRFAGLVVALSIRGQDETSPLPQGLAEAIKSRDDDGEHR